MVKPTRSPSPQRATDDMTTKTRRLRSLIYAVHVLPAVATGTRFSFQKWTHSFPSTCANWIQNEIDSRERQFCSHERRSETPVSRRAPSSIRRQQVLFPLCAVFIHFQGPRSIKKVFKKIKKETPSACDIGKGEEIRQLPSDERAGAKRHSP